LFMVVSTAATCSCWSMLVTSCSGELVDDTQTHTHKQCQSLNCMANKV